MLSLQFNGLLVRLFPILKASGLGVGAGGVGSGSGSNSGTTQDFVDRDFSKDPPVILINRYNGTRHHLSYRVQIGLNSNGKHSSAYITHFEVMRVPGEEDKIFDHWSHHHIKGAHKVQYYLVQGPLDEYRSIWQQLPIDEYEAIGFLGRQEELDHWEVGIDSCVTYDRWFMFRGHREGPEPEQEA